MLPRRTVLAIAAVLDAARRARAKPLPAKALAARYDLAPRQFETLLQDLVKGKILKSLRGPHGGYELARERRRISLGDIVRAMDGAKPDGSPAWAGQESAIALVIEPALQEARSLFLAKLDAVSVEDLCRRAEALDLHAGPEGADFAI